MRAHFVTANLFTDLGAVPRVGRLLDPSSDEAANATPVVVLSSGFWERHFGADASIAGKTIRLNGKPITVAGVAAPEFSGLSLNDVDAWLPLAQHPYLVTGSKMLTDYSVEGAGVTMFGRLRAGATPKAAEAELQSLAAVLHTQHPDDIWAKETLPSRPGGFASSGMSQSHHGTGARDPDRILPIAAAVGTLVLLILAVACGNLGGLLLARGVARQREIAIRTAVGAGKGRLVRQLFTESVLLGILGSVAGLGLGYVVLRALMSISGAPRWLNPAPDWRVVLFAIGMGFAAAILFGLTPSLEVVRRRQRATVLRQVTIAAQVAASCVLLIVAGLLVRMLNQAAGDPGFAYQQMVSIDPALGSHGFTAAQARTWLDAIQTRLRNLPGVEGVALASNPPFGRKNATIGTDVGQRHISLRVDHVDSAFFRTLGIPLRRGRLPLRDEAHALVLGQSLAEDAWPGQEPLGKVLDLGSAKYTVVGIAADTRIGVPQEQYQGWAYFPAEDADLPGMTVMVRTAGRPEALLATLAGLAKAVDPEVLPEVQLMRTGFERNLRGPQYSALAVGVLAAVALLLACLGIVGLVAYAVSQRTKEIGIRMALGARPADVLGIVLRQFSRPVGFGLLAGVAGAAALSHILGRILFGLGKVDPLAYVCAVGLFAATAGLAALFPARRALKVDPMRALRCD